MERMAQVRKPREELLSLGAKLLDHSTFDEFYLAYFQKVFNYVSYRVADERSAEEVTSVVFERAFTRLHTYRSDRGAFSTWLFTIAKNEVASYFRSKRRQPLVMSLDNLPEIELKGLSPEAALIEGEKFRKIQVLVHALPEREQEVIALKFGNEMTNLEIARILSLTPTHVGVLLHRSVRKLRIAILNGEKNDGP